MGDIVGSFRSAPNIQLVQVDDHSVAVRIFKGFFVFWRISQFDAPVAAPNPRFSASIRSDWRRSTRNQPTQFA